MRASVEPPNCLPLRAGHERQLWLLWPLQGLRTVGDNTLPFESGMAAKTSRATRSHAFSAFLSYPSVITQGDLVHLSITPVYWKRGCGVPN
jgi:hypothetical protein